jgi:hypothetical protein
MYFVAVLLVLGLLGFKMYLQSRSPVDSHRPAAPITDEDIEAAIRAKRIVHAIQMYGLLYQCDLTEATEAVEEIRTRLKAEDVVREASADPTAPEELPPDHRGT